MVIRPFFLLCAVFVAVTVIDATADSRVQVRPGMSSATIEGNVSGCGRFSRAFGPDFVLVLQPEKDAYENCVGWKIEVRLAGDRVNLAEMNLPPHGPSVLDLYAWHFADKTVERAPWLTGDSVYQRVFAFSPEVKSVYLRAQREGKGASARYEDVRRVGEFGRGDLRVLRFTLAPPHSHPINPQYPATGPQADTLSFRATMSWPSTYTGFAASAR